MKYLPKWRSYDKKTVRLLLEGGLLEVSTCFENAVAKVGKYKVISEDQADLSDGSDCKMASARTHNYGRQYGAPITSVSGKTGTLRIQVYERKQNKFYYFAIPRDAYKHISKTSNIDIPFDRDTGDPKRANHWWAWECESFKGMCIN